MQENFNTVKEKEEYLKSQGYKLTKEPWEETYILRPYLPYLGHGNFNEFEMAEYYPYNYKISEYANENNEKRYIVEGPQGLISKSPSRLRYLSNQTKQYLDDKQPEEYEKRLEKVNNEKHLIDYLKNKYQLELEYGDLMFSFYGDLPSEEKLDTMIEGIQKAVYNRQWSSDALWEMSCGRRRQMTAVNAMFNGGEWRNEEEWIFNEMNSQHSSFITEVAQKFLYNAIEREQDKGRYVDFDLCEDKKLREKNGKNYCNKLTVGKLEKQGFEKEAAESIIQTLKSGKDVAFFERIMNPWETLKITNRLDVFAKDNGYIFDKNNFLEKYIFDDNVKHDDRSIYNHERNLITSHWVKDIYRNEHGTLDNGSKEVFFNCLNIGKSLKESLDDTLSHYLENGKRNSDIQIKEWNEELYNKYNNWVVEKAIKDEKDQYNKFIDNLVNDVPVFLAQFKIEFFDHVPVKSFWNFKTTEEIMKEGLVLEDDTYKLKEEAYKQIKDNPEFQKIEKTISKIVKVRDDYKEKWENIRKEKGLYLTKEQKDEITENIYKERRHFSQEINLFLADKTKSLEDRVSYIENIPSLLENADKEMSDNLVKAIEANYDRALNVLSKEELFKEKSYYEENVLINLIENSSKIQSIFAESNYYDNEMKNFFNRLSSNTQAEIIDKTGNYSLAILMKDLDEYINENKNHPEKIEKIKEGLSNYIKDEEKYQEKYPTVEELENKCQRDVTRIINENGNRAEVTQDYQIQPGDIVISDRDVLFGPGYIDNLESSKWQLDKIRRLYWGEHTDLLYFNDVFVRDVHSKENYLRYGDYPAETLIKNSLERNASNFRNRNNEFIKVVEKINSMNDGCSKVAEAYCKKFDKQIQECNDKINQKRNDINRE